MRILIMDIVRGEPEDVSSHRWELIRNLSKIGCEVHAIAYTEVELNGAYVHTLQKKNDDLLHLLLLRLRYIKLLFTLARRWHFAILYTRNDLRCLIGLLIKKTNNSKLIYEVNGIISEESKMINKCLYNRTPFKSVRLVMQDYLGTFVAKKADSVIAVTEGIKNFLVKQGVKRDKIFVIGNGANIDLFKPIDDFIALNMLRNRYGIDEDDFIVLFIGNLAPWQGVEYILHAAPLVIKGNPKTKFLIVGDGILRGKLESLVKELNMEHDILFTGVVQYEKVPQYINASDVCVVPKRKMKSGYSPLKLYEYMACGKPVIATNTAGFEILTIHNAGVLINPEDSEELSNAITRLLQNKQLREQMGANGRKLVVKEHSWENSAKKTIGVFRKVLK